MPKTSFSIYDTNKCVSVVWITWFVANIWCEIHKSPIGKLITERNIDVSNTYFPHSNLDCFKLDIFFKCCLHNLKMSTYLSPFAVRSSMCKKETCIYICQCMQMHPHAFMLILTRYSLSNSHRCRTHTHKHTLPLTCTCMSTFLPTQHFPHLTQKQPGICHSRRE